MGRQIAILATKSDEEALLQFLRETAHIELFVPCAPTIGKLWVERFAPYGPYATQYYVWNKSYAWKPKFGRVRTEVKDHGGWYFVENPLDGPVIEFCRSNVPEFLKQASVSALDYGRIYWAKYNRQKGFAIWFEKIIRWIRKNGRNLSAELGRSVFWLPDAWEL